MPGRRGIIFALLKAMSMTWDASPKIYAANIQDHGKSERPPGPAEFARTGVSQCECLCCKGGIEFETAKFNERIRTNLLIFGQEIKCPHCGRFTSIYLDNKPRRVFKAVSLAAD